MDKNSIITGGGIPNYPGRGSSRLPGKILLIEDDLDILKLVRIRFESKGYEVLTQMNALEIMKVCLDDRPDVIVLDAVLPYREVADVFIELRGDPSTAGIPIVFVFIPRKDERPDRNQVETLQLGPKDAIVELPDVEGLVKSVEQALPPHRRNLRGNVLWQADD